MSDGGPQGIDSGMLASMQQAGNGMMNGGAVGGSSGFGTVIGGEQLLDQMSKSGSLDANMSFGSIEDLKGFIGAGVFDDNLLEVFDGSILSSGNISYYQALAANNLGWGSVEAGQLMGLSSNLNMPKVAMRISSKGMEGG